MDRSHTLVVTKQISSNKKEYWLEKFKNLNPKDMSIRLLTPKEEIQSAPIADLQVTLEPQLSEKLIRLSNHSDVTLFIVLLSAFVGFQYRYTGQEEIIVTVPAYNEGTESDSDSNELLMIRKRVEDDVCFRNLLIEMKEEFIKAIEYSDYLLTEIIEELNLDENRVRKWLHSTIFASENLHNIPSLIKKEETLFLVTCSRKGGAVEVSFTFDRRICHEEDMKRMLQCYQVFLSMVLDDMALGLSRVKLMTESQEAELLAVCNQTRLDYPKHETIIRLFEEQVLQSPDQIAIVYGEKQMTYSELNRKANFLARQLRKYGVKRESPVCIMLDRGLETVVGIVGILKAGGAYIPIDPKSPDNRINYMLKESQPILVLTTKNIAETHQLPNVLLMDSIAEITESRTEEDENPAIVNEPTDLAYLLFTSGSTGKPKASMIEHRNVINLVAGLQERILKKYDGRLRIAMLSPFIFDMSVEQMFGTLLYGHSLYIVPEEARVDGERLLEFFIENEIDLTDGTPSHLILLLEAMNYNSAKPNLKQLVIGGESLPKETVERMFSKLGPDHVPIITNSYGLTECCVDSTYFDVTEENVNHYYRIPIGYPLPNQRVYILNKHNILQPVGVIGELCIAGDNVGRGYLNRDELNAKTFVDDPFHEGQKMYRTGDLAIWLPDGNVECLGRMDTQVKIRGYRIELEEIENVLRKHPSVTDVKVLVINPRNKEQSTESQQLCVYIVTNNPVEHAVLREFLIKDLPDYMIPAYFVNLERMPLNQNDKVDRSKLPPIDTAAYDSGIEVAAPTNEREEQLVLCWKQVLGRESVGIKDNFFGSGGDSIKAIQLVSRLRRLHYKIEVRDIFTSPTIEQLAKKMVRLNRTVNQEEVTGRVPLTPIQHDFFLNHCIDPHHFNQSVLLDVEPEFDVEAARFIFSKIQEHHDALRIIFLKEGNQFIQINRGLDMTLSIQHFDLYGMDHQQFHLKERELQSGISLENGPLMNVVLFDTDAGKKLFIYIHHTVIDGVSWRILFEDIDTLYRQYKEGKRPSLPLKSDSFKTWSEKLYEYANSEELKREIPHWKKVNSLMKIPKIRKDIAESYFVKDEVTLSFALSETETDALLNRVNYAFNSDINDILLTALGLSVNSTFGIQDVSVELEGHGREPIIPNLDISRTVGWFTSWYPVIIDVSGDDDLAGQIKRVKESLRAVPNKGVGYLILKHLSAETEWEDAERPQICFNYLGQFDADSDYSDDAWFKMADESIDSNESPERRRENDFVFNGVVIEGKLHMNLLYSHKQYKTETVKAFLEHYRIELLRLISFCTSRTETEVTPSDLGYKGLTMEQLDSFFD